MNRNLLLLLSVCVFLSACATTYNGRLPNLELKGEAAQQEVKKFHINDEYWDQASWYEMGPERNKYTLDSMAPVIEHVSPEGKEKLNRALRTRDLQRIIAAVAIASLLFIPSQDESSQNTLWAVWWTGFFANVGLGLMRAEQLSNAAETYNRDLKKQLTPGASLTWNF